MHTIGVDGRTVNNTYRQNKFRRMATPAKLYRHNCSFRYYRYRRMNTANSRYRPESTANRGYRPKHTGDTGYHPKGAACTGYHPCSLFRVHLCSVLFALLVLRVRRKKTAVFPFWVEPRWGDQGIRLVYCCCAFRALKAVLPSLFARFAL